MKKVIFLSVFLFVSLQFNAQDFNKINDIKFTTLEDYKKAEPEVLKTVNFLLRTPIKPETDNRIIAMAFVIKWMSGTDYTFNIGEDAMKVTKGSSNLFAMYMVALAKAALDNPNKKLSDNEIHEIASKTLAGYCSKKDNKLKPNKALKKIIKKMK